MSERKIKASDLVELQVNGELLGVFSSEKAAEKHMKDNLPDYSYTVLPLGTLLFTDII